MFSTIGEDVDIYEDGDIVSNDGAWRSGVGPAEAGLFMPGTILLGSRFFQEIAPDVALDRAEIVHTDQSLETPYEDCMDNVLVIKETTPLEAFATDFKYYAPEIGLIKDGVLELVGKSETGISCLTE